MPRVYIVPTEVPNAFPIQHNDFSLDFHERIYKLENCITDVIIPCLYRQHNPNPRRINLNERQTCSAPCVLVSHV